MNDPHVVALFYNIKHKKSVVYREAEPRDYEEANFSVRIEDKKVRFTMKAHYATREEAKEAVREYIDNWEFMAGLEGGPSVFKLVYRDAEIVYRDAEIGHHVLEAGRLSVNFTLSEPTITLTTSYPSPPQSGLKITPDVQSMYDRLMDYRSDPKRLPSMAAFCLDVLQESTGSKSPNKKVAEMYGIERAVIKKIARLSNNKGGPDARKRVGINSPLTPEETCFLEEAIKALILRAAEVAHDPKNESRAEIKLSKLPQC